MLKLIVSLGILLGGSLAFADHDDAPEIQQFKPTAGADKVTWTHGYCPARIIAVGSGFPDTFHNVSLEIKSVELSVENVSQISYHKEAPIQSSAPGKGRIEFRFAYTTKTETTYGPWQNLRTSTTWKSGFNQCNRWGCSFWAGIEGTMENGLPVRSDVGYNEMTKRWELYIEAEPSKGYGYATTVCSMDYRKQEVLSKNPTK